MLHKFMSLLPVINYDVIRSECLNFSLALTWFYKEVATSSSTDWIKLCQSDEKEEKSIFFASSEFIHHSRPFWWLSFQRRSRQPNRDFHTRLVSAYLSHDLSQLTLSHPSFWLNSHWAWVSLNKRWWQSPDFTKKLVAFFLRGGFEEFGRVVLKKMSA